MSAPTLNRSNTSIPHQMKTPSRSRVSRARTPSLSRTPKRCPRRESTTPCSDRFIPKRSQMNVDVCSASLLSGKKRSIDPVGDKVHRNEGAALQAEFQRQMKAALFDIPLDELSIDNEKIRLLSFSDKSKVRPPSFKDPNSLDNLRVLQRRAESAPQGNIAADTKGLQNIRRISTMPTRVLDAPDIVNDYYINILSWNQKNVLAVALGRTVWLWNSRTLEIHFLMTTGGEYDFVTSVSWATHIDPKYIAIGTTSGTVQLWDTESYTRLRVLNGHDRQVGALSWSPQLLSSAGRDSVIVQHDVRVRDHLVSRYCGHGQAVCGLRWDDAGNTLASGGNDNLICIWDAKMSNRSSNRSPVPDCSPRLRLTDHTAAVKALAWCPFRPGMLASGGGMCDGSIKFWNTSSGSVVDSYETGSQVVSLLWSQHNQELLSAHGFGDSDLILWKYPTMKVIKEFGGHCARVLHMEQSPDSSIVVSASADETLHFWDIFGRPPKRNTFEGFGLGELELSAGGTIR